jgi:hypothetical protein
MLFGETVAVYCENHTEHTDTLCGQNAEFWYVQGDKSEEQRHDGRSYDRYIPRILSYPKFHCRVLEPANRPYPESAESIPHSHNLFKDTFKHEPPISV